MRATLSMFVVVLPLASALLAQSDPRQHTPRTASAFVENRGQWRAECLYAARLPAMSVALEKRGFRLGIVRKEGAARRATLALRFDGTSGREPILKPESKLQGRHNYLTGKDPKRWRTGVPLFASVLYKGVYPDVDVRARFADGSFEYDFVLEAGADLSAVRMSVHGARALRLNKAGSLVIDTELGSIVQPCPIAWEVGTDGKRRIVTCRYRLLDQTNFGFVAPERDRSRPFVVDPKVLYSSYLGGSGSDTTTALRVDARGRMYLGGHTRSLDFPTTVGAYDRTHNGGNGQLDAFVSLIDPSKTGSGQLVFSTFIGGGADDTLGGMIVDSRGVHLLGSTFSKSFPTTANALQPKLSGGRDAYYARLDPTGSKLLYSTYFGGSGTDAGSILNGANGSLHVDAAGIATMALTTDSPRLPTTANGFDRTYNGVRDCFLLRLDPAQPQLKQLVYASYFGGSALDQLFGVAPARGKRFVIWGRSDFSTNFPVTKGAYDSTSNGGADGFVVLLDLAQPPAGQLRWGSFLGGRQFEWIWNAAVDIRGQVTVCGQTWSTNFPTTKDAFDRTYRGNNAKGFVARFSADGARLIYSTYLGSQTGNFSQVVTLDVDHLGCTTVSGASRDIPTTPDAIKRRANGTRVDGFLARLDPKGSRLLYSTLIGGPANDATGALQVRSSNDIYVNGFVTGQGLPTTPNGFQTSYGGGSEDAFVMRLRPFATGVRRYGDTSMDCKRRKPTIHALDDAFAGSSRFGLATSQSVPNGLQLLLLSAKAAKIPVLGMTLWVDPAGLWLAPLAAVADSSGEARLSLPIPPSTSAKLFAQFVSIDAAGCPQNPFSASDALEVSW